MLLAAYTLILFSDYNTDENLRKFVGWGLLGLIAVAVLINLIIVAKVSTHGMKLRCKRRTNMKKYKKLLHQK